MNIEFVKHKPFFIDPKTKPTTLAFIINLPINTQNIQKKKDIYWGYNIVSNHEKAWFSKFCLENEVEEA